MEAGSLTEARRGRLPWLIAAASLALAAWAWWPAPESDVVATSLAAFEKQNRLTVFSAQLSPVVASDDDGLFGMLKSKQVAVIPARVDYTLDLSAVDRNRLGWSAQSRRLDVRLPPLTLGRPNLDEGRAQYLREGVWISRRVQDKLTRENTLAAEKQARESAANPVLMELARASAKEALRQNLAIPLEVAGFGEVTIAVRFDGDKEAK